MSVGQFQPGDLPLARPPLNLTHGFRDMAHAARHARLTEGQLTTVGVERESRQRKVISCDSTKGTRLSLPTETGGLQGQQHHDGVAVVQARPVQLQKA